MRNSSGGLELQPFDRAYAGYGDQEAKEPQLLLGGESEKQMAVFPDMKMGVHKDS